MLAATDAAKSGSLTGRNAAGRGWDPVHGAELVGGTPHAERALVEDVGVLHGRAQTAVPEELLDGPNVVARLPGGAWRWSGGGCGWWRVSRCRTRERPS